MINIIDLLLYMYPKPTYRLAVACRGVGGISPLADQFNALEWNHAAPDHNNPSPLPTLAEIEAAAIPYELEILKNSKIEELKVIRDSKKALGIKYKTNAEPGLAEYDNNEESTLKLLLESTIGGIRVRKWRDRNNLVHDLGAADLLKMHILMSEFTQICEENYNIILLQISTAASINDLNVVILDNNWPTEAYYRDISDEEINPIQGT